MGMGTGSHRVAAAVPQITTAARRSRPPLSNEGRDQRPLLRDTQNGAPRGWKGTISVGRYWRCALVVFFNYGIDTGTVWKSEPAHEPILWRHISWGRESPDREVKEQSPWGWLFYRRVKTGKAFYRPMNRVVHAHIKSIVPENPHPDDPVFLGGGSCLNARFGELCSLAEILPKRDVESDEDESWVLKDLRKTCATYYDEHIPESSVEILGHSVGGIHLSPLCPSCSVGVQSDHDPSSTDRIFVACQRFRWRVSLLPKAICRVP